METILKKLFSGYYRDVYSYLYSLTRDAALSEDLTADVFLEVVKSISTFRGESDVKTWLFSIARHKWFDHLRRKKREIQSETLLDFYADESRDVERDVMNRAAVERVYALLRNEPERTRNIVLMRLEGYSFYEIGQKYGVSESSARVIDFRAKAKIREILKKEGYGHE